MDGPDCYRFLPEIDTATQGRRKAEDCAGGKIWDRLERESTTIKVGQIVEKPSNFSCLPGKPFFLAKKSLLEALPMAMASSSSTRKTLLTLTGWPGLAANLVTCSSKSARVLRGSSFSVSAVVSGPVQDQRNKF